MTDEDAIWWGWVDGLEWWTATMQAQARAGLLAWLDMLEVWQ